MVARQELQREERRASRRRAAVVETTSQQLLLRPPAEHAHRAEAERALAEVRTSRRRLQLVVPLGPQRRQLLRRTVLRKLVGAGRCFCEVHCPSLPPLRYAHPRWRTGSSSSPATAPGPS